MPTKDIFTTIRTEGALLPPDLLQHIADGDGIEGLTPESYHLYPGEKINEVTNFVWNRLQGAWQAFRTAQERLPEDNIGTSLTREKWLLPLFDALGYGRVQTATAVEIDGRSYPISHGWSDHVPIHLMSYKVDLDRRTPNVVGAATASPHSLLQVFLNRSDEHLWGFVSNGYKLRILRDNASLTRQAYVEFDLEAMMDGEVYSDFVLLWLLCHQSRVEDPREPWLEQWMRAAEEQGTRALEQLRVGVEEAITALGLGFIEHPSNHELRDSLQAGDLDAQDYYRQLLRVVYRLLFLFVAEDRDLLLDPHAPPDARDCYNQYYSTDRLRRMAATFRGTRHHDLFEGLRLVMRLLSGDSNGARAGLGLVPLGSFLFSDDAVRDIIDCQISNTHFLDAIRALSLTYDDRTRVYRSVDYKNLGSEELGSVYESLLELHPQINIPGRRFALATAGGNERKTTGSYYTPTSLVNALLDSALDPVIEAAISPHPPTPSPSGGRGANAKSSPLRGEDLGGGQNEEAFREMASKVMVKIARDLRKNMTTAEEYLWTAIRKKQLGGLKFRKQHPIAKTTYVVDFFCYEANLIIEVDGEIHQYQQQADAERQAHLESLGYTVIRFTNDEIFNDLEGVLAEILDAANRPHPLAPSPSGGRGAAYKSSPLRGEDLGGGQRATTTEQRILDLKICDPACGSGHFLIAAANRIAKALAYIRTGEEEPPPAAIQQAKRDVIGHCIYGVDINPMAVELCKVNLWMEALEPGKPLSFLDHRILVGNSLLGTTPRLMAEGIPDDAFKPIEGDDKKVASEWRKKNRDARKEREKIALGQGDFFHLMQPPADYGLLADAMHELDSAPDDTLSAVRAKEARYRALADDPEYIKARLLADAWCAAFVWEKHGDAMPPMTDLLYRRMEEAPLADNLREMRETVVVLADHYQFFHWHVAFPDVFEVPEDVNVAENEQTGWNGGFDCVLGNPPWERIKLEEKQWFSEQVPEISEASTAAIRKQLIEQLKIDDSRLHTTFLFDKRRADGEIFFARSSAMYPLSARGDVNTYALFTELSRKLISASGFVGVIIPTGIATDFYMQDFFNDMMLRESLVELIGFENEEFIFSGIANVVRFCVLIVCGTRQATPHARFGFYIRRIGQMQEDLRFFHLSDTDIALVNPNTLNCPIFRNQVDANLTRSLYKLAPVIEVESDNSNPWGIEFSSMFHMTSDSNFFAQHPQQNQMLLYEAKFIWHYDHRFAGYDLVGTGKGKGGRGLPNQLLGNYANPEYMLQPRYWVPKQEVQKRTGNWDRDWFIAFRDIASAKLERTGVFAVIPYSGVGNSAPLLAAYNAPSYRHLAALVANLNSLAFDFLLRQKVGGTHLNFYILKQIPIIPPEVFEPSLIDFVVSRVLELSYTSWHLEPFAQDVGWVGAPFIWDEERRFLMRCELDALYFHLYGLNREETNYILDPVDVYGEDFPGETFRVLKEKEVAKHGEYVTKRIILEMYDQMASLPTMAVPAPKDPDATYQVPDVSQWQTWLTPPPASPDVAHEDDRG